ncbi:hypothetical protein BDV12DRAFT_167806 [Aspergillus spectabilis]
MKSGYTNSTSTAYKEQLPDLKFSEEEDRWIQWARDTVASMKAVVSPVSSLPVPPTLPPRPAPIIQELSETSINSSANTTFTEVPRPVTPCIPPEIRDKPITPPILHPLKPTRVPLLVRIPRAGKVRLRELLSRQHQRSLTTKRATGLWER